MCSKPTPQDSSDATYGDELKPGTTLLHGQYVIEQFLNHGGFGITYLAKDSLHRLVVIKECFPETLVRRGNSTVRVRSRDQAEAFRTIVELFIEEARNLARLSHPNIVGVHQVFEDNDTAYMAMDFVQGRDLLASAEAGAFTPPLLERTLVKLLDAVEFMHLEGILHRDIAPDNILLGTDNEPVLIDFGAARETVTRETSYLGSMRTVKDGYSPQEFYVNNSEQHPSSDLYSLGAALYHVMCNELPVSAQLRLTAIAGGDADPYVPIGQRVTGYSEPFLDAIDKALMVFPKDRIQSAAEWRALITRTRISQATRGSVSRPMLAVDNGNVVHPFEEGEAPKSGSPKRPAKPSASRMSPRPKASADKSLPAGASAVSTVQPASGKGLYVGVAAAALLAVIGGGAFIVTGAPPSQGDVTVAAATAPAQDSLAAGMAADPAPEPARKKPEQLPFFLADSSSGDVNVTAAKGSQTPRRTASADTAAPAVGAALPNAEAANASPAAGGFQDSRTAVVVPTVQTAPQAAPDATAVITRKTVRFDVTADPADPTIVASVKGPLSKHLSPGDRLLSVNGYPIAALDDFQRVVDATSDYEAGETVKITFGIEKPASGTTLVRDAELPALRSTSLPNGARFLTEPEGDGWATVVTSGTGTGEDELRTGDRVVAFMPTNELIDGPQTLGEIFRRELATGSTLFNFAVARDGEMWLVSMPIATGSN